MTTDERQMVASAVLSQLASLERSVAWLARQAGMPYSTLRGKISGRSAFTVTDLAEIAHALGISPAALVPPPAGPTPPPSS